METAFIILGTLVLLGTFVVALKSVRAGIISRQKANGHYADLETRLGIVETGLRSAKLELEQCLKDKEVLKGDNLRLMARVLGPDK